MPVWEVEGPDGRRFEVEGDHQPSEAELAQVFATLSPATQDPAVGAAPVSEEQGMYIPGVGRLPTMRQAAETVADWAPTVGGAIGGTIGGIGGTVGGMGVGGIPGAAGGAAVGAAGGEAARRLIREAVLAEDAPTGGAEAARAIAGEGAIAGGTTALGGGAIKLVGMAGRPLVKGAVAAAKELIGSAPPGTVRAAAVKGFEAAAGKKIPEMVEGKVLSFLKPAEKAKVAHAVKRSVKEILDEAAQPGKALKWEGGRGTVVDLPKGSVKAAAPAAKAATQAAAPATLGVPVEDILSDMTKRVTSMHGLGIDPKDISKSLVKHYTSTGRGAGLTAGKMRGLVDEIIKTTPKAETNLADEMASKVIGWAKGSGFSRAQMDDALRREYPVELTPAKAREVVDFILDSQKIGPKRTAYEMGQSTNQQIRGARGEGPLLGPIHKGR